MIVSADSEKENDFRDEKTENEILVYCIPIALQTSGQKERTLEILKTIFIIKILLGKTNLFQW